MSPLPPMMPRAKRLRWLSLAAVIVLLPAALWARSYESAMEWRGEQELNPLISEPGKAIAYGPAEWRLEGLYGLRQKDSDSVIILAEFEARITDPQAFTNGLCRIHLSDRGEKRWSPLFIVPRDIRKARPSIDERLTCASATLKSWKAGDTVKMAETFAAPAGLKDFELTLSTLNVRPAYLVLR